MEKRSNDELKELEATLEKLPYKELAAKSVVALRQKGGERLP